MIYTFRRYVDADLPSHMNAREPFEVYPLLVFISACSTSTLSTHFEIFPDCVVIVPEER